MYFQTMPGEELDSSTAPPKPICGLLDMLLQPCASLWLSAAVSGDQLELFKVDGMPSPGTIIIS